MSGVAAQILEIRSRNLIQPQLMCCCAWLTPANQHSIQPNQHLQHPTRWFLRCVSLSFSSQDVPSQKEKHGLTIPTTTIRHHPALGRIYYTRSKMHCLSQCLDFDLPSDWQPGVRWESGGELEDETQNMVGWAISGWSIECQCPTKIQSYLMPIRVLSGLNDV